jgi:hypothetical protein
MISWTKHSLTAILGWNAVTHHISRVAFEWLDENVRLEYASNARA